MIEELRISGGEFIFAVITLAAGSVLLLTLMWLWSVVRRHVLMREIKRNEVLFNAFFTASPAGMAILDRDLFFLRVNGPLAALHGVAIDDHLGRSIEQVVPALAAVMAPLMRDVLLTGQSLRDIQIGGPAATETTANADNSCWLLSLFPIAAPHVRNPIGLGMVVQDISPLKQVQQALESSRAELRRLGVHREDVIEREHQRLAREFHDELGQLLTTARLHLQLLARQIDGDVEQARESVRTIDAMIVDAYRSIKNIASDLRPAALNLGLTAAIEWLVGRMFVPLGVHCTVDCAAEADRLDGDYAIALFRIVQESLTNIVRHAAAQRVRITIRYENAALRLLIEDDGRGFATAQVDRVKQFGLLGIAERVAALGGQLELDSAPGQGTRLAVVLFHVVLKPPPAN